MLNEPRNVDFSNINLLDPLPDIKEVIKISPEILEIPANGIILNNKIEQKIIKNTFQIIEDNKDMSEPKSEPLLKNESLNIMSPLLSDNTLKTDNPGYIVGVPINLSKQNLQAKIKKSNIKKSDDILQTIKQYHNVRLDDAKRTLK